MCWVRCARETVGYSRVSEKIKKQLECYSLILPFAHFDCVGSVFFVLVSIYLRLISKKRMENKDSILNLKSHTRRGSENIKKKKRRAAAGDYCPSSCPSCNERKRKEVARWPQFEAANLRSSNEKLFGRKRP
ncbi:hypothetical protein M9H77_03291 [Catharanthus roseus]|uniref:Uncharacterized protein n=1 Tax=Catharanthus roseus TaxID=4058 RepID=A0ACC0CBA7_CATRO|nr:hypothetical protein M9H77_03291 [Catharanthus roseus]